MFKILVCEDDRQLRELFCAVLRSSGYEPIPARDGAQALEITDRENIDLVISDVLMPKKDGWELTRELRQSGFSMPILLITALGTGRDKREGFTSGADDYMVKPIDIDEMVLRVEALLRRSRMVASRRAYIGDTVLDCDTLTVTRGDKRLELRKKEFFLLFKLLSEPGRIFSHDQLLDDVWGMDGGDQRTLEVHISSLRSKLRDFPDFRIVTVRGIGYKAVTE